MTRREEPDPDGGGASENELARQIAPIVATLAFMRRRLSDLSLPATESADELRDGLDLAWLGGKRLLAEVQEANLESVPERNNTQLGLSPT